MGFSRQEHWTGLPFPPPGDLPDPGIEPGFPALQADWLPPEPSEKPKLGLKCVQLKGLDGVIDLSAQFCPWVFSSHCYLPESLIKTDSAGTCILSYVKQIASPGSIHETGHSGPVHWDDPEGWDGEGGGNGAQDGEHMYTHGWFMSMYGKNHCNIVK